MAQQVLLLRRRIMEGKTQQASAAAAGIGALAGGGVVRCVGEEVEVGWDNEIRRKREVPVA